MFELLFKYGRDVYASGELLLVGSGDWLREDLPKVLADPAYTPPALPVPEYVDASTEALAGFHGIYERAPGSDLDVYAADGALYASKARGRNRFSVAEG